jgi:hypothetical protein
MNESACPRAWHAEAAEDGRLSRADGESFARHVAVCRACAREVHALRSLRDAGRRITGAASSALDRRRLRNAILRRANTRVVHGAPRFTLRAPVFLFAVLVTAAALWFGLRAPASLPELAGDATRRLAVAVSARVPAGAPAFELQTSHDAAWHTLEQSSTLRLAVRHGRFALSVRKLQMGQRFLLDLPDGELEVTGTRFVVQIQDRRTRAVRVSEGRVVLRIEGRAAFTLGAGQAWSLKDEPAHAIATTAPASRVPVPGPSAAVADAAPPAAVADSGSDPAPNGSLAGAAFARAMSAFSAGDYAHAEQLFSSFEQLHPADARVEDAAFLRAVARARRGDPNGARLLAHEYLRRYPGGLRRVEAERLTH